MSEDFPYFPISDAYGAAPLPLQHQQGPVPSMDSGTAPPEFPEQ